jgi:hypothetical protein
MGRARKPTEILEANGAYLLHPERRHPGVPKPDRPLGNPPKYMDPEHKKLWKQIAKRQPPGVLLETDREAFELMINLTYIMRTDFTALKGKDTTTLLYLWSHFAMTPADRTKVNVDISKGSKLDAFINRKKQATPPVVEPPPVTPPVPPADGKPLIN